MYIYIVIKDVYSTAKTSVLYFLKMLFQMELQYLVLKYIYIQRKI